MDSTTNPIGHFQNILQSADPLPDSLQALGSWLEQLIRGKISAPYIAEASPEFSQQIDRDLARARFHYLEENPGINISQRAQEALTNLINLDPSKTPNTKQNKHLYKFAQIFKAFFNELAETTLGGIGDNRFVRAVLEFFDRDSHYNIDTCPNLTEMLAKKPASTIERIKVFLNKNYASPALIELVSNLGDEAQTITDDLVKLAYKRVPIDSSPDTRDATLSTLRTIRPEAEIKTEDEVDLFPEIKFNDIDTSIQSQYIEAIDPEAKVVPFSKKLLRLESAEDPKSLATAIPKLQEFLTKHTNVAFVEARDAAIRSIELLAKIATCLPRKKDGVILFLIRLMPAGSSTDYRDKVSSTIVKALGAIGRGSDGLANTLIDNLKDKNDLIVGRSARVLGLYSRVNAAIPELRPLLNNTNTFVKSRAALTLGRYEDQGSYQAIQSMAASDVKDEDVKRLALFGLLQLDPNCEQVGTREAISKRLKDEDSEYVRTSAKTAVNQLECCLQWLHDELISNLRQDDIDLVRKAMWVIKELDPKVQLVDSDLTKVKGYVNGHGYEKDITKAAIDLCFKREIDIKEELQQRLREDNDDEVQEVVIESLADIQEQSSADLITPKLEDDSETVRKAAVRALIKLRDNVQQNVQKLIAYVQSRPAEYSHNDSQITNLIIHAKQ